MPGELADELTKLGDRIAAVDASGVAPVDVAGVLNATERCRRALSALDARLHAQLAPTPTMLRDTLRSQLNLSNGEATRRCDVAGTVAAMPAAGDALAAGTVSDNHLHALSAARQVAGDRLDAKHADWLLAAAADMPADQFRSLAVETARQLCIDAGEVHHENLRRRRSLRWWRTYDGMTRLTGDLDPDSAAALTKAVERELHRRWHVSNPAGHRSDSAPADNVDARRLDALVALCTAQPTSPAATSTSIEPEPAVRATPRAEVGVMVDYQTLCQGLHTNLTCQYDTGDPIPPSLARTLACDADIYPVLLGTASDVLDLGRTTRVPNRAQRRALAIRDRGCVHARCTAPPAWCDAHHVIEWWGQRRGPTHIDNLVLLCRHHHTQLHRGAWALPPPILERAELTLGHGRRRAAVPKASAPP